MIKVDVKSLQELRDKILANDEVMAWPVGTGLTARGLLEGMKMICDDNPICQSCPLALVSSCVRPDPEVIDIVKNYIDNKYFGGEG